MNKALLFLLGAVALSVHLIHTSALNKKPSSSPPPLNASEMVGRNYIQIREVEIGKLCFHKMIHKE
jgi:hypothetical protein